LVWGVVGLLTVWTLLLPLVDARNVYIVRHAENLTLKEALSPRWNYRKLASLVWLSLPLGFVMLLNSLNYNIPRLLIETHLSVHELGIFAAVSCFMIAGNVIIQAMAQSVSPILAGHWSANNSNAYAKLLIKQLLYAGLLGVSAVSLAIVAGPRFLTLCYRPEYAEHSSLLVMLMIAGGIEYVAVILDYALTAARYLRSQLALSILVTATIAVGSHLLLPLRGLAGVAEALIAAAAVHLIGALAIIIVAVSRKRSMVSAS
jgi:O-antigen/teichoic acid export membrane protein